MFWISSNTDSKGIKTIYPPQPSYDKMLKCSQCGGMTQFLHFYPEILPLLENDDKVPSFCSNVCAIKYTEQKTLQTRVLLKI